MEYRQVYVEFLTISVLCSSAAVGVLTNILSKRTFLYHSEPLNWTGADVVCSEAGGKLASVLDISTLLDVDASLKLIRDAPSFWIGLRHEDELWKWRDGSELEWNNWKSGDSTYNGSCVASSFHSNYMWESFECSTSLPFLCEFSVGRCWFKRYNHTSIVAYNMFGTISTLEKCRELCIQSTEILCLSFEYNTNGRFCQLSNTNRWIHPDSFAYYDLAWNYHHRTCVEVRLWSDDDELFRTQDFTSNAIMTTTFQPTTTDSTGMWPRDAWRYLMYNNTLSWYEAKEFCKNMGGNLATIYSQSTLPDTGYRSNKYFWVGLQRDEENIWGWINDSVPLTWTNWRYTPSNFDMNSCVSVFLDEEYKWYPTRCLTRLQFICQFPAPSCIYQVFRNASILANNNLVFMNITVQQCEDLCDTTTSFVCRSFEYNYQRKQCHISNGNKWTLSTFYKKNVKNWEYHHRKCNFGVEKSQAASTTEVMTTTSTYTTETTQTDTMTTLLPTTPKPTTEHIKTFEEIKEDLISFGEKVKRKRILEKKTSVFDNRPSATSVGVVAIVILSSILGGVVLLDIGTIGAHCKYMKNPYVGRKKKTKKTKKKGNKTFNDVIEMCKLEEEKNLNDVSNQMKENKGIRKNGNFNNVMDTCNIEDETNISDTINTSSNDLEKNNNVGEESATNNLPEPEDKDAKENLETKAKLDNDNDQNGYEKTETKVDLELGNNCVSLKDLKMDPNINENELFTHL